MQAVPSLPRGFGKEGTFCWQLIYAGIQAATAPGTVRANRNAVPSNGTGLSNSGVMQTCSNNKVYGNTTEVTGSVVAVPAPGNAINNRY
ncbi:MAG: hypothetical protein ACREA9_22825 [Pyrinomonadaceae bacterium]